MKQAPRHTNILHQQLLRFSTPLELLQGLQETRHHFRGGLRQDHPCPLQGDIRGLLGGTAVDHPSSEEEATPSPWWPVAILTWNIIRVVII